MAKSLINNRTYDFLKFLTMIVLPALGTLYFAAAGIWGMPYPTKVVGTIVAVDTFFGVVLSHASKGYNKRKYAGDLVVKEDLELGRKTFNLALNEGPEDLDEKNEVLFKVKKTE